MKRLWTNLFAPKGIPVFSEQARFLSLLFFLPARIRSPSLHFFFFYASAYAIATEENIRASYWMTRFPISKNFTTLKLSATVHNRRQPPHNIPLSLPALPTYIQSKFSVPSLRDDNVDNDKTTNERGEGWETEGERRREKKVEVKSREKAGKMEEECYNCRSGVRAGQRLKNRGNPWLDVRVKGNSSLAGSQRKSEKKKRVEEGARRKDCCIEPRLDPEDEN